jgi:hypothetical protein
MQLTKQWRPLADSRLYGPRKDKYCGIMHHEMKLLLQKVKIEKMLRVATSFKIIS